jgi:hypothetical protein
MDDVEDLFRMVSDPEVTRYTGDGGKTLEDAWKGLEERLFRDEEKHGYDQWASALRDSRIWMMWTRLAWATGFENNFAWKWGRRGDYGRVVTKNSRGKGNSVIRPRAG